jgi:hypothetical protein
MADLTPAARVEAWRKAKRKQGYKFVGLWMTPAGKGELDAVAWDRQQDLGDCVLDLVRFYSAAQGTADVRLEARQQHRIEANVADDVIKRLVAAGAVPSTALGAPSVVPAPLKEPPPPGLKQCGNPAHPPYDTNEHDECPIHASERKQRYRDKKAKQRSG